MNLIIDIGNTNTKYSVYHNDDEIYLNKSDNPSEQSITEIITNFPKLNTCIISATGHIPEDYISMLKEKIPYVLEFNQSTPIPFNSLYKTQNTLGVDRIAAVAGALKMFPEKNVLIIDAGTAITYDFITKTKEYQGGNISPGMSIRFQSLNTYTNKLPLVSPDELKNSVGTSTNEAILNGVVWGIIHEMHGTIDSFQKNYKELSILLTGGDAHFFDNKLKKTIFVVQNLVSLGLNTILNYNVETN